MAGRVELRVTKGPLQGSVYAFEGHDAVVFGRAPDCHIRLPPEDTSASRHHFLLEVSPPAARLRDLGSLNGTYVNRVKCGGRPPGRSPEDAGTLPRPEVDLRHGDAIKVGKTRIEVRIEAVCEVCGGDLPAEGACPRCPPAPAGGPLPAVEGYAVTRLLAEGGMGAVYLARDGSGREVALKLMASRVPVSERSRAEFLREIALAASLEHERIVRVLGHGACGGAWYLAMEYCRGGSVEDLRRRRGGRISLAEAGPLVLEALDGLAFAHEAKGVIHRDLKPGNLLLTALESGHVKVADFGLAKSFDLAGMSGITLTGSFGGSYPFMPREQILDFKYCRPATDVWAMAATFYFLLTARSPHEFPPGQDPIVAILDGEPVPLLRRDPSLPARLAEVVDRALAQEPSGRYPDARAFRAALEAAL